jgi:hypothetical protein
LLAWAEEYKRNKDRGRKGGRELSSEKLPEDMTPEELQRWGERYKREG